MCGIAVIIQQGNREDGLAGLEKMTAVLAHRGPDGKGHWQNNDGTVMLGHRRLAIIDLTDTGCQPMPYLGRYHIVHNGEIYNYTELKQELQQKGYSFRSTTDTEVILAAFDCWGDECVEYFDGMFAFAIWDEKEQRLFAARDRFGEKSLYYFCDGSRLLLASEMKALWAAGIPKIPNLKMLFNFITIGYTDNPEDPGETFYENVSVLPAAATLTYTLKDNGLLIENYWDLDAQHEDNKITDSEATEKFNHLLRTSVLRRLRSDVAVGSSLSGGLDSSAIAAWSRTVKPDGLFKAYTAVFPGFEKDEGPFAERVARHLQLQHATVAIDAGQLVDDWDKLCYYQEEPFGSASAYAQFKVFELAATNGTKVLLDGQGADETLAGYLRYYKWYWQELFRKRKLRRSGELAAAKTVGIKENFGIQNMIASYFPDFATIVLEKQYLLKAIRHEDLSGDFVRQQSREAYYTVPSHFTLNGILYFSTRTHGLGELLRLADRNAMAHGREVRLPFLSHELVEFLFSLPAHYKIRNGWTKWILRESVKDKLPEDITWRKNKVGFEPPQREWMSDPRIQEAIREAKKILVEQQVLKPAVLEKGITPHGAHSTSNTDWRYLSAALLFK